MQPLTESWCGIIRRVCSKRVRSLSEDNSLSICDVLRYEAMRRVTFIEVPECRKALKDLRPIRGMGASCWARTNYCCLFLAWTPQRVKCTSLDCNEFQYVMKRFLFLSFATKRSDGLKHFRHVFCVTEVAAGRLFSLKDLHLNLTLLMEDEKIIASSDVS